MMKLCCHFTAYTRGGGGIEGGLCFHVCLCVLIARAGSGARDLYEAA